MNYRSKHYAKRSLEFRLILPSWASQLLTHANTYPDIQGPLSNRPSGIAEDIAAAHATRREAWFSKHPEACRECGARGFAPSKYMKGCELCDGTFAGLPPELPCEAAPRSKRTFYVRKLTGEVTKAKPEGYRECDYTTVRASTLAEAKEMVTHA